MPGFNFDFMGKINEFLCDTCAHRALAHYMHRGPCSDCWRLGQTICRKFISRDEDQAEIAATFEALTNG